MSKIYTVIGIRKEFYKLDIKAKNKSEAIEKFNDFVNEGVDWYSDPGTKFIVKINNDAVPDLE